MSISRLGYALALIGGILMIIFGILAVAQSTFRVVFYGWGFFNGGIVTLLSGLVAVIGANRVRELTWAIILIIVGLIGGGLGGLLVLLGGILGLIASMTKQS
jgi:hypothetical protein